MRPIATDTHDFPSIRRDGCIYVDKTKYIHRLVTTIGTKLFFISRPRRFGKSLTVSALKALFSGRRELFKGLYIDGTDWKWEKFPIIHFEFNDLTTTSLEGFEKDLAHHVEDRLAEAGYTYPASESFRSTCHASDFSNVSRLVVSRSLNSKWMMGYFSHFQSVPSM